MISGTSRDGVDAAVVRFGDGRPSVAQRRDGWFPEVLVRELIDGRYSAHGDRAMPVWGRTLSQEELIAITEHLYAMQTPAPPASTKPSTPTKPSAPIMFRRPLFGPMAAIL